MKRSIQQWIKIQKNREIMTAVWIFIMLGMVTVMSVLAPDIWMEAELVEKIFVVGMYAVFIAIAFSRIAVTMNKDAWKVTWTDVGIVVKKSRYSGKSIIKGESHRHYFLTVRLNNKEMEAQCEPSVYKRVSAGCKVRVFTLENGFTRAVIE